MADPRISSKSALKDYMLRHLGAPVVNIEITDDQLEDAIDSTLDDYLPVAYSGIIERYIPITFIEGISSYILPYDVFAVIGIHTIEMQGIGNTMPANLFSINNFIAADLYKPGTAKIDLVGYELVNEMLETMNIMFRKNITYDFNCITKVLHLFAPNHNDKAIIQVYKKLDVQGASPPVSGAELNIYNEKWIKRMCTARAQLQWGRNLLKYAGTVLPNGGTLNAEFIYNEAKDQIEKLLVELQENFTLPTDFYIA